MCVCVCVFEREREFCVCVHVRTLCSACAYVQTWVWASMCVHAFLCECAYLFVCVYVCVCVRGCAFMFVCKPVLIRVSMLGFLHLCEFLHLCLCLCEFSSIHKIIKHLQNHSLTHTCMVLSGMCHIAWIRFKSYFLPQFLLVKRTCREWRAHVYTDTFLPIQEYFQDFSPRINLWPLKACILHDMVSVWSPPRQTFLPTWQYSSIAFYILTGNRNFLFMLQDRRLRWIEGKILFWFVQFKIVNIGKIVTWTEEINTWLIESNLNRKKKKKKVNFWVKYTGILYIRE